MFLTIQIFALFILGWAAYRFKGKNFFLHLFSLMYMLVFICMPIGHFSLNGYYIFIERSNYGVLTNDKYFLIYSLVNIAFSSFLLFFSFTKYSKLSKVSFSQNQLLFYNHLSFILISLGFVLWFYVIGGFELLVNQDVLGLLTRGRMEHYSADASPFLRASSYYLMSLLPIFYFTYFLLDKKSLSRIMLISTVVIMMLVLAGGRKWLIMPISGFTAGYILSRNIKLKDYFLGFLLIFFLIIWQFFRSTAFKSDAWDETDMLRPFLEGDIIYFYYVSLESIRQYYESGLYIPFATIRALIFLPFPTEYTFGVKVPDLAHLTHFFAVDIDFREANNPPSFIGLGFINLGIFGVVINASLIYFLQGFLKLKVSSFFSLSVYSTMLYLLIRLLRGSIGGFYVLFFQISILCGAYLAYLLLKMLIKKRLN